MNREIVSIEFADPLVAEAAQMMRELTSELRARYEGDDGTGLFNPADVMVPRSCFLIARIGQTPIGCGALRPIDLDVAEIKRMYVVPSARGAGVAKLLLTKLVENAASLGYSFVQLETGVRQPEAIGLYTSFGFQPIPKYGPYVENELSVCFGRSLVGEGGH